MHANYAGYAPFGLALLLALPLAASWRPRSCHDCGRLTALQLTPAESRRLFRHLALLILLFPAPAVAGESAFGKPQPVKAGAPKSDHCVAAYGEGFNDIGGTGACVKIGGRVRVDFGAAKGNGALPVSSPAPSLPDKSSQLGTAVQGFAEADVRRAFGDQTLRVFARVRTGAGDDFLLRGNPRQ